MSVTRQTWTIALWTFGVLIAADLLGPRAWWVVPPALALVGVALWARAPQSFTPRFLAGLVGGLVFLSVVLKLLFK